MDEVFKALADPQRRELLDRLNARGGQTLRELCAGLEMSRQAVSKHLAVLEAAHLVTAVRRGREKWHYLNAAPITELADRWITRYDRALADLRRALEDPMDRPTYVNTSFIRTTPERLWAALTEPAFTRRYWQTVFETDWAPGSPMTWNPGGVAVADPGQVVLESDPPRRLSYTWHTFTPEWAAAVGVAEEVRARIAAEPRSRVTYEIAPDSGGVTLTVTHDRFEPGSTVLQMCSAGWPHVVGELKTLLEAGGPDGDGLAEQVAVDAPVDAVHAALTSTDGIAGWWTRDVSGDPGREFTVRLDGRASAMRVDHLDPGLVVWTCTADDIVDDWVGTSVWFTLRPRVGGGTDVALRHVGLVPELDGFAACRSGWERDLRSLAAYVEGGAGTAEVATSR